MTSTPLLSSPGNSSPSSNEFLPSSRNQCKYAHQRSPHGFLPDSSYLQSNSSFNSFDENDRKPEGLVSTLMYYAWEGLEAACFQLTNWYTRISLLIGYLILLLLTLIFLTFAGYFDLNTWRTRPFEQQNR